MARMSSIKKFLLLTLLIITSEASHTFTAFPLPHVDLPRVGPVGGRQSSMFFPITEESIYRINDIPENLFTELLTNPSYRSKGILILLPEILDHKAFERLEQIEQAFISHATSVPIAFAPEDAVLSDLYGKTKLNQLAESGKLYFKLKTSPPSTPAKIHTIQAWLYGKGNQKKIPTLAVVANFDTFSMIPPLASNLNRPTSGAVALIECLRLFQRIYANPATRPAANLLFVLTGGSAIYNFEGVRSWWTKVGKDKEGGSAPTSVLFLDAMATPAGASEGEGDLRAYYSKRTREQVREEEETQPEEEENLDNAPGLGVYGEGGERWEDKTVPPLMLAVRDAAERCGFVVREEGSEMRNVPANVREERRQRVDRLKDAIWDRMQAAEEEEHAEQTEAEQTDAAGQDATEGEEEEGQQAPAETKQKSKPKQQRRRRNQRGRGQQGRRMLPLRAPQLPHEALTEAGELDAVTLSTMPPTAQFVGPRRPPLYMLDYPAGLRMLHNRLISIDAEKESTGAAGGASQKSDGTAGIADDASTEIAEQTEQPAKKGLLAKIRSFRQSQMAKARRSEATTAVTANGTQPGVEAEEADVYTNVHLHTSGIDIGCTFDLDSLTRNTRTAAEIILAFLTQQEAPAAEGEEKDEHIISLGSLFPNPPTDDANGTHPQCLVTIASAASLTPEAPSAAATSPDAPGLFMVSREHIQAWHEFFSSLTASTAPPAPGSSPSTRVCPGIRLPASFFTPDSLSNNTRIDSYTSESAARDAQRGLPPKDPSATGAMALRAMWQLVRTLGEHVVFTTESTGRHSVSLRSGLAGTASIYATLPRAQFLLQSLAVIAYLALLFVGLSFSPFGTFEWKKDKKEKKQKKE